MAFAVSPPSPADDSAEAIRAAANHLFSNRLSEGWFRFPELLTEPIFTKQYPKTAYDRLPMPDFDVIAQPLDFVGLNIYTRDNVRGAADGSLASSIDVQTPRTRFDA